jgi:ADP-ribose pyrophosphatase
MADKDSTILFDGRLFQVRRQRVKMRGGGQHTLECVVHRGSVTIVPLLEGQRVCMIRSHRPAVGETLYELPAGTLEAGEDPDAAARRELEEETGYRGGRWSKLLQFFTSPGFLTERMHLYLAEDLTPGPARPEADEDIAVEVLAWDEAMAMVADGRIIDGKTLVGLLYCQSLRGGGA